MTLKVLVTGGAGYIGSHACIELLMEGHEVIVIDNLHNSHFESINRVEKLTNKSVHFFDLDLRDYKKVQKVFSNFKIDAVMHFAGLKSVSESITEPTEYYSNNLNSTFSLCKAMSEYHVKRMVFSSSSTVYGIPSFLPVTEDAILQPYNPYGQTKLMIEQFLRDVTKANKDWAIIMLRYFNPIGAHVSGQIGEDPQDIPNNLLPYISQVAVKKLKKLSIYGDDYPTSDGTCIRDYIHVVDLVRGHVAALDYILEKNKLHNKAIAINLGTGRGYSVLEVLKAFENACGFKLDFEIVGKRPGDIPEIFSDPTLAKSLLGWKAKYDINKMCLDTWNWQKQNPNGFS